MKFTILLLFVLVLMGSCGDRKPEEQEVTGFSLSTAAADLYQVVGDKHDTAMLLMKGIGKAQNTLRGKLKKIEGSSPAKDSILNLLTALKKGDDGMMDWMREFKNVLMDDEHYKAKSEDEIMAYLREEDRKIEQVHIDMINSIEGGENFLAK
jgi:hypothetical protein